MRIQIFTDAWHPQINGVVRTLSTTRNELIRLGHDVGVVEPGMFSTVPCPTYHEIRLAMGSSRDMKSLIDDFNPQAIHIATEGPIGWSARAYCLANRIPFSTAFHTRFPEYVKARFGLPRRWMYKLLRHFHWPARHVMVPTPSVKRNLEQRGFRHLALWSRGVDTELFRPLDARKKIFSQDRPVLLYVGRVAVEKNLHAFLNLKTEGRKVVVGDGPQWQEYKSRFPEVEFVGAKSGEDLALHYSSADVFVFPSLTDTFGLVMLEALACGVPVAAFPVTGPVDVIRDERVGVLHQDLDTAVQRALSLSGNHCREYALGFSWEKAALQFLGNLHRI